MSLEKLTIAWLFKTDIEDVREMLVRTRDGVDFSGVPFTRRIELQVERANGDTSQPVTVKAPTGDFKMRLVEDSQGEGTVELYEVK